MSKKIEVVGNFLIVTDTDSGVRSPQPMPLKEMGWNDIALTEAVPRIVFETTSFLSDSTEYELYPPFVLSVAVDTDDVAFTVSTFRDFCTANLGKSSGGSASIPTSDIFHGGFVDYNDLATSTTALVVTAVGSPVSIPNDGAGAFTNKSYLPIGVTDIWNTTTGVFDWSQLKLGDMVDIRLDFDLITASTNTEIKVDLHLGTGAGEYTIPFMSDANFKTISTHPLNRFNGIYLGDTNTLNNGGKFKITTDKDCTIVVNGWYCKIIRKG